MGSSCCSPLGAVSELYLQTSWEPIPCLTPQGDILGCCCTPCTTAPAFCMQRGCNCTDTKHPLIPNPASDLSIPAPSLQHHCLGHSSSSGDSSTGKLTQQSGESRFNDPSSPHHLPVWLQQRPVSDCRAQLNLILKGHREKYFSPLLNGAFAGSRCDLSHDRI